MIFKRVELQMQSSFGAFKAVLHMNGAENETDPSMLHVFLGSHFSRGGNVLQR